MIIPPDPEKDPRLFDPSASTSSLVQPSEFDDTTSRWDGESLPPYERRRSSRGSIISCINDEDDIFADHHASASTSSLSTPVRHVRQPPPLIIHNLPNQSQLRSSPISSSDSLTPTASRPSLVLPHFNPNPSSTLVDPTSSTSKLWENSSSTTSNRSRGKKRICGCLPIPPSTFQRWWKKWKRWIQAIIVLALIAIGLAIGLLVGMNKNNHKPSPATAPWQRPWMDQDTDGKRVAQWAGNGSYNLTYTDSRDGPSDLEGKFTTECNNFSPFNATTSPFSNLFTPFPHSTVSLASFSLPFSFSGKPSSDIFINAKGLGSSGTLNFLGSDGPEAIITAGEEGKILIDVIIKYSGCQDLSTMMKVCKMTRGTDGLGIGIYSPRETDGKMTNPFKLDPSAVPTSLIVIRLPPSLYGPNTPPLDLPSFSLSADNMVVNFGNLNNVVSFDSLNLDTMRGGVDVTNAQAKRASIVAYDGHVKGTWNVTETLIVNVTEGSITSDVILSDPMSSYDDAPTLPSISDYTVGRRTPTPSPSPDDDTSTDDSDSDVEQAVHALFNSTTPGPDNNSTRSTIVTNLFTTSGYVNLRYLHQPSTIDLSAIIGTQQGNMNIKFHPSYVGPFITRTHWGQINLPSPGASMNLDPKAQSRIRQLLIEPIQIKENTTFSVLGYTQDKLQHSTDTISGYVYWANMNKTTLKPIERTLKDVQDDSEHDNDNQVMILGNWGNVDITFDGQ
ncbi:uncharacterized protein L201_006989 [Kwoniella dendrophila CBS 6074]|uniref:Uncharacterized protein n=1 Tax=Kwoniella dendrophila CBS 6074 TaxID=1295534 RepID=A0AAX4K339_9TREE